MSTGFDAWNTPGWDAQNPVYLSASEGGVDLPDGVHPVKIVASYVGPAGGAYGQIRFIPRDQHHMVGGVGVLLAPVRAEVRKGELDASLTVLPVDLVWEVHEAVGPTRETYEVIVPASAVGEIELAALQRP